jgi:predicted amidohydrolase
MSPDRQTEIEDSGKRPNNPNSLPERLKNAFIDPFAGFTAAMNNANIESQRREMTMAYQDVITVACANIHQLPGDRSDNLITFKNFIREAASKGGNLIIFPEMSLTPAGVPAIGPSNPIVDMRQVAETIPGYSTDELAKEARDHNIYIVAGMLEKDKTNPDTIYNTAPVIGPEEGLIGAYRKVHLFKTEKSYATPGKELPVFETRYGPIGVLICSDFFCYPETARTCALKGARLIALPTAVMVTIRDLQGNISIYEGAIELVPDIIRVRAYENHIYIAAANAVGASYLGYRAFGKSMIVGPDPPGSFSVRFFAGPASQVEDELIVATLDLKAMDEARRRLWENRFPQAYGAITQR